MKEIEESEESTVYQPTLGSVMLGTSDPERLHAWYLKALRPEVNQYGWLVFGAVTMLIDGRDDVSEKNPEPGRVVLNLHVADARTMVEHLDSVGVTWLAELEEREHGQFATLIDPDGNYVQIIEMNDAYLMSLR
ncbi:VOC family protein [Amycolatopsis nigrescens]|uniref:VOC family protein n=1 Tax=Amycolatopsis nigrescens TaxID=381445 RepID=UPI00037DF2FF|nr:VOC family protein [Amycolatopsis nigrescens]